MADKASFLMYLDTAKHWDLLSDAQAGALIKALFKYCETGEQLQTDDGMLAMAFSFITAQIDRDTEKYESTCKKRSESIKKRWEEKNKEHTNDTKEYKCIPNDTNDTNETDNDNDSDNETDNESDINLYCADKPRKRSRKKQKFTPPTVEEVRAYCKERKNGIDPQQFVNYYAAVGWRQNGQPITDWKAKVQSWESRQPRPPEHHKGSSSALSSIDTAALDAIMNPYSIGSSS